MNTKKLFIIASILLSLTAGALVVYNFLLKEGSAPPAESPAVGSDGQLPSAGTGQIISSPAAGDKNNGQATSPGPGAPAPRLRPVSQEKVFSATLGENGRTVKYYTRPNGYVWESAFDGSGLKKISSTNLATLIKALWSPDKEKVIGIFSENNQVKKYLYSYVTNQAAPLSEDIGYAAWSPDSKKIVYQYNSSTSGQSNISIANPDGSNWQNIFKTRLDDLVVEWPTKNKISFASRPSALAQGFLYAIDPVSNDFNRILSEIYGLAVKWSPTADKILFSTASEQRRPPRLMLTDEKGEKTKDLKLAGLADKCVWSRDGRTIFCGLPQQISANALWPDDYYKGRVVVNDDFYKINLETDEKTKIAGSSDQAGYDSQELFLSAKEDYLFFTNRKDGLLYSLRLQ